MRCRRSGLQGGDRQPPIRRDCHRGRLRQRRLVPVLELARVHLERRERGSDNEAGRRTVLLEHGPVSSPLRAGPFHLLRRAGGGYEYKDGTSMAAPHVAGAWAILKALRPSGSVSELLGALRDTGKPVVDPVNSLAFPRIRLFDAAVVIYSGAAARRRAHRAV